MMKRKELTIGLFGLGCVGYGLYEVLEKTPSLRAGIKTICVKTKDRKRPISTECISFDKNDILNDPEINVVVELIDDAQAAFEIVSAALARGKAVVSANKKMIAEHFTELLELQKKYGAPLLYEAACCASIPIIRNLEEYFNYDLLESISGIVNGSTNYILSQTSALGINYVEALKIAQEKGYVETDPTLDTGGFDAKFKLQLLIAHAFGLITQPNEIFNLGIDRLGEVELNFAKEKSLKIKLIAQAFKNEKNEVVAMVIPAFIGKESKFYNIDDVFNGLQTKTCFADEQFFAGKGAGAFPTASAVLSDISALTYDYRYEYKKLNGNERLADWSTILLKVFVRSSVENLHEIVGFFEQLDAFHQAKNESFIIGNILLNNLNSITTFSDCSVVLCEVLNQQNLAEQQHSVLPVGLSEVKG